MNKKDLIYKKLIVKLWELVTTTISYKRFSEVTAKVDEVLAFIGPELKDE